MEIKILAIVGVIIWYIFRLFLDISEISEMCKQKH